MKTRFIVYGYKDGELTLAVNQTRDRKGIYWVGKTVQVAKGAYLKVKKYEPAKFHGGIHWDRTVWFETSSEFIQENLPGGPEAGDKEWFRLDGCW